MIERTITSEQKIKVFADPQSTGGNPAQIEGPLRVTVQAGNATVTQDPAEPNAFYAVSADAPGETTFLIEGDADLGAGVQLIQDTLVLTVTSPTAVSFGLRTGDPELKNPAAPPVTPLGGRVR